MAAVRTATVCAGVALAVAGCTATPSAPVGTPTPAAAAAPTSGTAATPDTATTDPTATPAPPFIARLQWVRGSGGRSLHIVPTAAGRTAQGRTAEDEAWTEVLRLAPDADQPGMRAQFDCHWTYARLVQPDKPSWNIEPWRPVVTESRMADARCNPGGPESAEG